MPNSSVPACCIVINQQQQQNTEYHDQYIDEGGINSEKIKSKHCTVVENGLVVVRLAKIIPKETE